MHPKDVTVEKLIAILRKKDPKAVVRVAVGHDLEEDNLVRQGPVLSVRQKKKGLVILATCDDTSHGFGTI